MFKQLEKILMSCILAFGLIGASIILGNKFKNLQQTGVITVKGLAEVDQKADHVEWRLGVSVWGETYGAALEKIKTEHKKLIEILTKQGFTMDMLDIDNLSISQNMINKRNEYGDYESVRDGYNGEQFLTILTTDLSKVQELVSLMHELKSKNDSFTMENPRYLISDLDAVKRSLIAKATQDAKHRAQETLNATGETLGKIKRASQGAFYIFDQNAERNVEDYSGVYQTNKVNKVARLVVTVDFAIE